MLQLSRDWASCTQMSTKKREGGGNGKGKPGGFKGNCHNCDKIGHKKSNCCSHILEDYKSTRPSNRKSKSETGPATNTEASGNASEEFMLMAVRNTEFPDSMKLLNDPNIWIAETGTTVDNTYHTHGVVETRKGDGNDGITDASGKNTKSSVIGNIPVTN